MNRGWLLMRESYITGASGEIKSGGLWISQKRHRSTEETRDKSFKNFKKILANFIVFRGLESNSSRPFFKHLF
ncbi:hypothetical protein TA5114_01424 [Cognatishimia activa]|uniref:Uncharacterized protein n=1 Tax=Cognatishimia activa TaxID=1715691 RepID=A0A0P1J5W6_9RHOB|nr:hypothetical protein TA5113_01684 [Cognatishimia activa]CUK25623.1 hypothetical protein TA5114_01424 [Cognatishimia activa]